MPPENSNTESPPQHQGTAFLHALRREPHFPLEREEKQLSHPPFFRLRCRPARSAIPPLAADAAYRGREGDPGRPEGGRSAAAGADITRQGREGPRRRPTRHAAGGVQPHQLPQKGEYGGAGGVEGNFPLSPHAPRRAGDPPPVSGSSRNSGKNKTNGRAKKPPSHPCPAPGRRPAARAGQQPQFKEEQ